MTREWFVVASARPTYARSRVGPFQDATAAGIWADENRPAEEWLQVSIQSKVKK